MSTIGECEDICDAYFMGTRVKAGTRPRLEVGDSFNSKSHLTNEWSMPVDESLSYVDTQQPQGLIVGGMCPSIA